MSALRLEHVSYTYPGASRPALDDVTLEVQPGELCVLAGLSGQGKSTLLRAACGLAPHFFGGTFAGRMTVAGLDTRTHPPARLGAVVGALFQDPETQLVMGCVRSELALGMESRGAGPAAVARAVEEVALALGIGHLLDRATHELSGGEKQRVALGATLAGRPRVVLLDEPTSQLDPVAGDELIGLLRRLNQEWELTVVLCEHRLERCLAAADRVIALHEARVAHDGDAGSFLRWAARWAPALQTPAARLLALAGLDAWPAGVKQARRTLRRHGLLEPAEAALAGDRGEGGLTAAHTYRTAAPSPAGARRDSRGPQGRRWRPSGRRERRAVLELRGVWFEPPRRAAVLRGVDLALEAGDSVALIGRNGAGKSTLLRHAAGLLAPTRGRVRSAGRVALLAQNPGDYFLRERVSEELSAEALHAAGLARLAERDPRDLSGGERQRVALAIASGDGAQPAAVLALDEPTRGMDREGKAALAGELRRRAEQGQAVILVTHDPELAASCTERTVMLGEGRVIADAPTSELLCGGWYFATETARILGGAGGALLPEQGAQLLARRGRLGPDHLPLYGPC